VCVSLTAVAHNTAQNSSDKFPSYPANNHHSSDDIYARTYEQLLKLAVYGRPM